MGNETQPRFNDVVRDTYEQFEDDGSVLRVFQFIDGYEYDRIVIRFDLDDDVPHQLRIYEDEADETPIEKMAFQSNDLQFDPVSVIGKPQAETQFGIEPTTGTYEELSPVVQTLWKSLGFTVVPEGTEWIP
jgi:hypothetical protein